VPARFPKSSQKVTVGRALKIGGSSERAARDNMLEKLQPAHRRTSARRCAKRMTPLSGF